MTHIVSKDIKNYSDVKNELNHPFQPGDLVWCNIPSKTTQRGNSYYVRNIFSYLNKYSHGWHWDYFITIKNDEGYTVKMNAAKFRKRHHSISNKEQVEIRLKKLEDNLKRLEEWIIRL